MPDLVAGEYLAAVLAPEERRRRAALATRDGEEKCCNDTSSAAVGRLLTTPMLYTQSILLDDLQPQRTEDLVGMALKSDLEGYHASDDQLPAFPIYKRLDCKFQSKDPAFLKVLLKSDVADRFEAMMTEDSYLRKEQLGCASVYISPANCFFPGTTERVCTLRSNSYKDVHRLVAFIAQLSLDSSSADCLRSICLKDEKPSFRMAVPRKVIGTIIGREGLQIQKLRQGTSAHIHISPLFVSSDAACTERIISVVSRHLPSLITAAQNIAEIINRHPDRAKCRRLLYDRDGKRTMNQHVHVIQSTIDSATANDFLRSPPSTVPENIKAQTANVAHQRKANPDKGPRTFLFLATITLLLFLLAIYSIYSPF